LESYWNKISSHIVKTIIRENFSLASGKDMFENENFFDKVKTLFWKQDVPKSNRA